MTTKKTLRPGVESVTSLPGDDVNLNVECQPGLRPRDCDVLKPLNVRHESFENRPVCIKWTHLKTKVRAQIIIGRNDGTWTRCSVEHDCPDGDVLENLRI